VIVSLSPIAPHLDQNKLTFRLPTNYVSWEPISAVLLKCCKTFRETRAPDLSPFVITHPCGCHFDSRPINGGIWPLKIGMCCGCYFEFTDQNSLTGENVKCKHDITIIEFIGPWKELAPPIRWLDRDIDRDSL